jgi:hypothetical protein
VTTTILIAAAISFALKYAGHLVPIAWLEQPAVASVAQALPTCLLAALIVVQAFTTGESLQVDARLAGVLVAIAALLLRAPFLVVVIAAAAATALLRAAGVG